MARNCPVFPQGKTAKVRKVEEVQPLHESFDDEVTIEKNLHLKGFLERDELLMHSSLNTTVASVLVTGIQDMKIPTQILVPGQSLKVIDTRALVNSRADISCIDWDFVKKHKIPRTKLATLIPVNNVDEFANKTGVIWYTCTIFLHIEEVTMVGSQHHGN